MPPVEKKHEEQVAEFWNSVRERLISHHGKKPDDADSGIGRYRGDTERRGIGEAVYNQGVARTAEIVDGVIEKGLPTLTVRAEYWDRVRNHLVRDRRWPAAQADREIKLYRSSTEDKDGDDRENDRRGSENVSPEQRTAMLSQVVKEKGEPAMKAAEVESIAAFWEKVGDRLVSSPPWQDWGRQEKDSHLSHYRLYHQPKALATRSAFDDAEVDAMAKTVREFVRHRSGNS